MVIRREDGPIYYFDIFGVEIPPLFLKDYVDLGSNEKIQEYDESQSGAHCFYMLYLIDNGYRIKSALKVLVNQVKCPRAYNKCWCSCFRVKVEVNQQSSFTNQGMDGVRGMPTCLAGDNDNVKDNDNIIANVTDIDIVNANHGTCFADVMVIRDY